MSEKNNIFFIGGAGFIGSNLIKQFIDNKQWNIVVLETSTVKISKLQQFENDIIIVRGNIIDYDLINSILLNHKINILVHLVSTLIPGSSYANYMKEFEDVIFPTFRLINLCAEKKVKFIYFSSGGTIYGNNSNKKLIESDQREPISYYGLSKLIIEDNILVEHRRSNLKYLIIRPSNPYGMGQSIYGNQGLIAVAIGKIIANEPLIVWGDGSSIRDYIFIDDLVKNTFELIQMEIENEIINIGSGIGYSINDILSFIKNITKEKLIVKYDSSRLADVNNVVLDITKLKSIVNHNNTPIEEGIMKFYNDVNQF